MEAKEIILALAVAQAELMVERDQLRQENAALREALTPAADEQ